MNKTLKDAVNDLDHFALFCDNLTAQASSEFKESVSDQSGVCWYGLPEVPVLEDNISDRVLDHQLVGRKVRASYENGWFVGEIVYFNNKLNEFKIDYNDGTSDYVCEDDFNDLDLILQ